MELIILVGLQGAGKSTFCAQHLHHSHLRLSRDVVGNAHRLQVLFHACLATGTPIVLDNTNLTARARRPFVEGARAAGFSVVGYAFDVPVEEALARNAQREGRQRVPDRAIYGAIAKLEWPIRAEGFDALWRVRLEEGAFAIMAGDGNTEGSDERG